MPTRFYSFSVRLVAVVAVAVVRGEDDMVVVGSTVPCWRDKQIDSGVLAVVAVVVVAATAAVAVFDIVVGLRVVRSS